LLYDYQVYSNAQEFGRIFCPHARAKIPDVDRTSRPEKSRSDFGSVLSTERAAQVLGSADALPVGFPLLSLARQQLENKAAKLPKVISRAANCLLQLAADNRAATILF
jgi:hypothetical protein